MVSVEAPTTPKAKPPGPSLRVAIILIIAGAALAIPTLVAGVIPVARSFTGSFRFAVPSTVQLTLKKGDYLVYERTTSNAFSLDDRVTITPQNVSVVGPGGEPVAVFVRGDFHESRSENSDRFVGAVRFTTPSAGSYTISIRGVTPKTVLVARPLTDTIRSVIVWFVFAAIGGVVFIVGIVLLIVGSVRRGRVQSAFAYATPVPPGWHPDPGGSGRSRYWDGYRWTEHLH